MMEEINKIILTNNNRNIIKKEGDKDERIICQYIYIVYIFAMGLLGKDKHYRIFIFFSLFSFVESFIKKKTTKKNLRFIGLLTWFLCIYFFKNI